MTLSDSAGRHRFEARRPFSWDQTDVILYALGVGARPPDELALLDEACGPAVLPTFALIANWWAVKDLRSHARPRRISDRALRAIARAPPTDRGPAAKCTVRPRCRRFGTKENTPPWS